MDASFEECDPKQFNQAFKRNYFRFPEEFAFELSPAEFAALNWSQFAASTCQDGDLKPFSATPSVASATLRKHRGATYRPWAFTEHGALMAANTLLLVFPPINRPRISPIGTDPVPVFIRADP